MSILKLILIKNLLLIFKRKINSLFRKKNTKKDKYKAKKSKLDIYFHDKYERVLKELQDDEDNIPLYLAWKKVENYFFYSSF